MGIASPYMEYFSRLIEKETGIIYDEVNAYQLESRLSDIATQLGFPSIEEFWQHARSDKMTPPQRLMLFDVATNNETSFFRDPKVFTAIRSIIGSHAQTKSTPLRIWSAACSSGQEVYTLGIICAETKAKHPGFTHSILATDISNRILARAKNALYSQLEVQRGLSITQLMANFKPEAEGGGQPAGDDRPKVWRVNDALRQHITFRSLNLLGNWGAIGPFDLILCRNVLIYQSVENKSKVIARMYDLLVPGGHLILGGAESLIGVFDKLEWTNVDGAVVYRKKSDSAPMPKQASA